MARSEFVKLSLLVAAGFLGVAASLCSRPGGAGLLGAALALTMLAIAVIDWRTLTIPDGLNALAVAPGLAGAVLGLERWAEWPGAVLATLIRGAVMMGLFFVFRLGYRRLRGREGMGLGDVKLAGVAGIWLDWPSLPLTVEIAALSALGFVSFQLVRSRRALDPLTKLPFGTFFAPAIWIGWLLAPWWS
jgi:leader peptidase (prepilin peptidase)/N-methyltransferase